MAIEDDDKPRKKVTHEIGQDLSLLSVEELTERIALMTSEIERLQVAMTRKRASRDAADSFFKSWASDVVCGQSDRRLWRNSPCPGRSASSRWDVPGIHVLTVWRQKDVDGRA